jgi:hypothetical protein
MALAESVSDPAQPPPLFVVPSAEPQPMAAPPMDPFAAQAPPAPFVAPAPMDPFAAPAPMFAAAQVEAPSPRRRARGGLWILALLLFAATAVCAYALVRRLESAPTIASKTTKEKKPAKVDEDESSSSATAQEDEASSTSASTSASHSASKASTSASASPSTSTTTSASAPPTASESAAVAADMTALSTTAGGASHRVFVDGRVVGEGPGPMTAPCGPHEVKIGSLGTPKIVDLPCGGAITITP